MLEVSGTISCKLCAENTYNLSRGMLLDGVYILLTCNLCPFGAECLHTEVDLDDDDVVRTLNVKPNCWGHVVPVFEDPAVVASTNIASPAAVPLWSEVMLMQCPWN